MELTSCCWPEQGAPAWGRNPRICISPMLSCNGLVLPGSECHGGSFPARVVKSSTAHQRENLAINPTG
jgi:hypothetical protein